MIIDSHTHFGSILDFCMPEELLIQAMDIYGIDAAIVSNIGGIEFGHDHDPIPGGSLRSQIDVNQDAIDFSRRYPGRIFPLLWAMPHSGGASGAFEEFLMDNRPDVYGIKIHPYLNNTDFDSPLVEPYIQLAEKYHLPVVTHTAASDESSVARVAKMALKYPDVNFLMVHMGLYTDNKEAIDLILEYPNLYGDTAWVQPDNAMKLIEQNGIDKILFGTDCLVGGLHGYSDPMYRTYLDEWPHVLGLDKYSRLMSGNAIRLFRIGGVQ